MVLYRRLAMPLGVLGLCVVAALACDFNQIGQTITATPNLTPITAPPLASVSPAPLQSPTASVTPFPTATLDPKATPVPIDPCLLITKDDAASAIGAPVLDPVSAGGGCVYLDSTVQRYVLSLYALPAAQSAQLIAGRAYLLVEYGVQIQQTDLTNLQALGLEGDAKGVVDGLLSLSQSASTFSVQPVEKLGDRAIWVSKQLGAVRQSFLLVARGESLVGLDLVVTYARDESSVQDSAIAVAQEMLTQLPPRFVVAIPTPAPTFNPTLLTPRPITPSAIGSHPAVSVSPASASLTPTPTLAVTLTQVPALSASPSPTLKPPAFSVPITSSDQITYGGDCGLSLVTFTVTIADPSQISPIANASLFARVNDPASGQTTPWTSLPMQFDTQNLWIGTLNVETQLPGHEKFTQAFVEYYFSATNAAGVTAERPHYGVDSNTLTLHACDATTATATSR